jgi:hypothetical protein
MNCPETSAVEALRDGRLEQEPAETLRLHLANCAECTLEAVRLERLSEELAVLRGSEANPLRVAAGRRRLLDAARQVDAGGKSAFMRATAVVLAACAAAVIVWFGLGRLPFGKQEQAAVSSRASDGELAVTVVPAARTTWSRARVEATETLNLAEGKLAVQVTRHDPRQRLLVQLPDGELEDVGTVFTVEVQGGKTRAVAVTEGRVALRLRGRSELVLSAGESFQAPDESSPGASAAALGSSEPPRDTPGAPGAATKSGARPSPAGDELPACPSASLFQDGVRAFKHGEFGAAASLLERFSAACGRSNHAEDAAYLRMVALARAGRTDAARAQARAYLERFPQGFRRKEAQRLAGDG